MDPPHTHTYVYTHTHTHIYIQACVVVFKQKSLLGYPVPSATVLNLVSYDEREQKVMSVLLAFSPSRHYRSIHVRSSIMNSTFSSTQGIWKLQDDIPYALLLSQTCNGSFPSLIHSGSLNKTYTMYVKVPYEFSPSPWTRSRVPLDNSPYF